MQNFKHVLDYNLLVKGELNNLIFSIGFEILIISQLRCFWRCFEMLKS